MNDTEHKIAGSDIVDDDAERYEVIDLIDVGEFS